MLGGCFWAERQRWIGCGPDWCGGCGGKQGFAKEGAARRGAWAVRREGEGTGESRKAQSKRKGDGDN